MMTTLVSIPGLNTGKALDNTVASESHTTKRNTTFPVSGFSSVFNKLSGNTRTEKFVVTLDAPGDLEDDPELQAPSDEGAAQTNVSSFVFMHHQSEVRDSPVSDGSEPVQANRVLVAVHHGEALPIGTAGLLKAQQDAVGTKESVLDLIGDVRGVPGSETAAGLPSFNGRNQAEPSPKESVKLIARGEPQVVFQSTVLPDELVRGRVVDPKPNVLDNALAQKGLPVNRIGSTGMSALGSAAVGTIEIELPADGQTEPQLVLQSAVYPQAASAQSAESTLQEITPIDALALSPTEQMHQGREDLVVTYFDTLTKREGEETLHSGTDKDVSVAERVEAQPVAPQQRITERSVKFSQQTVDVQGNRTESHPVDDEAEVQHLDALKGATVTNASRGASQRAAVASPETTERGKGTGLPDQVSTEELGSTPDGIPQNAFQPPNRSDQTMSERGATLVRTGVPAEPHALGDIIRSVAVEDVNEVQTVRVELHPRHMGRLELRIAMENGAVTAQIMAEAEATRHALEAALPQLRHVLMAQGITVESLSVSTGGEGGHSAMPDFQGQGHGHHQTQSNTPSRHGTVQRVGRYEALPTRAVHVGSDTAIDLLA